MPSSICLQDGGVYCDTSGCSTRRCWAASCGSCLRRVRRRNGTESGWLCGFARSALSLRRRRRRPPVTLRGSRPGLTTWNACGLSWSARARSVSTSTSTCQPPTVRKQRYCYRVIIPPSSPDLVLLRADLPCSAPHLQGGPKKLAHLVLYALTSSNIDRFSYLLRFQNQEDICNNTVSKDPITPQVCRYTTLRNVSLLKATIDNKTTSVTTHYNIASSSSKADTLNI